MISFYKFNSGYVKKVLACVFSTFVFAAYAFGQTTENAPCANPGGACFGGSHSSTAVPVKGNPTNDVQNGDGFLGQIYNNTACGLDYVQGSVLIERRSLTYNFNTNGTGLPSSVNISGIPCSNQIDKAYLWIVASYTATNPPAVNLSLTNPVSSTVGYAMSLVGRDGPKCWSETGTATYRADVTSNISGNGSYNFNITGFTNGSNEIDGATLLIIYKNTGATYQGSLVLYDGATTSGTNNSYPTVRGVTMTGLNVCANSTAARAFLIVSDMQANINTGIHTDTLNGQRYTFPNLFWNFDQANTTVLAGQTTSRISANGQNSDCFTVAVAGLYYQTTTCTVCTPVSSLNISTASAPSSCGSCNGSASVSATGGTGVYSYQWANGQTVASASGLCAGSYSVTVADNSGCNTSVVSVVVAASSNIAATIQSSADATCFGLCNGTATASVSGGNSPYSFLWSNSQTDLGATALCSGSYSVLVTDASGCTSTTTVIISQPSNVTTSTSSTVVSCVGGNNGTATVNASGGTGAYSYAWDNGQLTATATGLVTGTYNVTVTDANGCTATNTVNVTANPLPVVTFAPFASSVCVISPAFALTGGSPAGGTYSGTGVSGNTFDPAVAGVGTFTLTYSYTDQNGCSASATASITVDPAGTVTIASIPNACVNGSPITLSGQPSGGTFSGTGVVGNTFDPAVAGVGTFTISYSVSNSSCLTSGTATTTVTVYAKPTVSISVSQSIGCINNVIYTGISQDTLTANSTYNIVSYQWFLNGNPVSGGTSQTLIVKNGGSYNVVVTDASGCVSDTASAAVTIKEIDIRCGHDLRKVVLCHVPPGNRENPQTICVAASAIPAHIGKHPGDCLGPCGSPRLMELTEVEFIVYPNPFSSETVLEFYVPETGKVTIELYDMKGALVGTPFDGVAEGGNDYRVKVDGTMLPEGIYLSKFVTADEVLYQKLILTRK